MDQFTRRSIGFGVQQGDVEGRALCRMFNCAASAMGLPICLSSDNDPLFNYRQWQANLRILEITEIKTVPYVPMSHPFVERLIGSVRREYLEHVLFWDDTRFGKKACRISERLQSPSGAFLPASGCSARIGTQRPISESRPRQIPMEITLSRPISHARGCVNTNSPGTDTLLKTRGF